MDQPILAPIATGGGIVAGISAGIIGAYQLTECFTFRTHRGECDQVVTMAVPAVVAGLGSVIGAIGGLFTYNSRLRAPEVGQRRRDERGRFVPDREV
jgi:NhaP-type Na+/H+ or K+/H+ antiporter